MSKSVLLKANERGAEAKGRSHAMKLRRSGRVPAILYGKRVQATNLEIVEKEIGTLLAHASSENILVDLEVGSSKKLALVQDVQHDAMTGRILHVDLHEIAPDETFRTVVPLETTGEAIGVKTFGGILDCVLRELHIECLPKDLPEVICVDVSTLNVGQSFHVGEIPMPVGVTVLNAKDIVAISVAAPAVEVAKEAGVTEAAQPEVLKEKKPAEGAAAPAAGAAKKDTKKK